MVRWLWVVLLVTATLVSGCTSVPKGNVLRDPGFEGDSAAWFWLEEQPDWRPFERSEAWAFEGARSARTAIDETVAGEGSAVSGAVQELSGDRLGHVVPARLSGAVRVEVWDTEVDRSYVQVVVGVFPASPDEGACFGLPARAPCQIAYVLGGVDEPPLPLLNRKYVIVDGADPDLGAWERFSFDVRDDYVRLWGASPTDIDKVWLYAEARYDASAEDVGRTVRLEAFWDDVYFGRTPPSG